MTTRVSFQEAMGALRANVDWLGSLAEDAVRDATDALVAHDTLRAELVVAGDADIDDLFVTIEQQAYALIATQAPVAADLRFLVSCLRVMSDWERTGGLAVWVAKLAVEDWAREPRSVALLREMADTALTLVRQARRAWREKDLEAAIELARRQDCLNEGYRRLTAHLLAQEGVGSGELLVHALLAGRHLDRVADHAVAVGDRICYMLTGKISSALSEVGPASSEGA